MKKKKLERQEEQPACKSKKEERKADPNEAIGEGPKAEEAKPTAHRLHFQKRDLNEQEEY